MEINFAEYPLPLKPAYQSNTVTGTLANHPVSTGADADWSSSLCGCREQNVSDCCLTCWCPCITFGKISHIVDKGASSFYENCILYGLLAHCTVYSCLFSCTYRSKLRRQYGLKGDNCEDCLVHYCCERCALCQEYRELKKQGFNMSIGWEGNMERQIRGVAMAPPVAGGGMRR